MPTRSVDGPARVLGFGGSFHVLARNKCLSSPLVVAVVCTERMIYPMMPRMMFSLDWAVGDKIKCDR